MGKYNIFDFYIGNYIVFQIDRFPNVNYFKKEYIFVKMCINVNGTFPKI